MRILLRGLIALTFIPAVLASQNAAPARPMGSPAAAHLDAQGFDPDRLARIDVWIGKLIADRQIPGAVVMLVRDGHVVYHKAFGVRDLDTRGPLHTDDIFRIASQTKAVTSTAVMMLWEEGKFDLDDPIANYLPAFRTQTVLTKFNPADSSYESRPAHRRITIRQLLTHTSGLDYADIGSADMQAIYAKAGISALGHEGELLGDKIDKLAGLPLKNEPGEKWTYSLSVDVLGRLVEVVSGMPLDQFFRTRIFEPLGMNDTYFAVPAQKQSRVVSLHVIQDGRLKPSHDKSLGTDADYPLHRVTYFSGGGGLSSTTADYARLLQMYLNGGELDGRRLLGRKTVEMMLTNQTGALQPHFGLGFQIETPEDDYQSPSSIGTFSWGGAFNTTYWADPKEHLIAQIYTSTYGAPTIGGTFKTLVYAAMK